MHDVSSGLARLRDFGSITAEEDRELQRVFVATTAFDALTSQDRYVALGRRGVGKTALYLGLRDRPSDRTHVADLRFDDYPWGLHDQTLNPTASIAERHFQSWLFFMLVHVAKLALGAAAVRPGRATDAVRSFIEANWETVDFNFRDFFRVEDFRVIGEIKPTVLGSSLFSISRTPVKRNRLGQALSTTLDSLESAVGQMLYPNHQYFLLFDDLDRGLDQRDEAHEARATGLLLAARRIAQWSAHSELQVRSVVFLRSDLFDAIHFADHNKIREVASVDLRWTADGPAQDNLRTLLTHRIRHSLDLPQRIDPWREVFVPSRSGEDLFQLMVRQTFLRPRDIIKLANLALQAAQERTRRSGAAQTFITMTDVVASLPQYSEYVIGELEDEIGYHWPDWRRYLEPIRRVGKAEFHRAQLEGAYRRLSGDKLPFDEVLARLFRFGILGTALRNGTGRTRYTFAHESPGAPLDQAALYIAVHPGLRSHLRVKFHSQPSASRPTEDKRRKSAEMRLRQPTLWGASNKPDAQDRQHDQDGPEGF